LSRDACAWLLLAVPALGAAACSDRNGPADEPTAPALGEIMTFTQMRHAKLFFAGEAQNWELAAYELKELGEGFEAAARAHVEYEGEPVDELLAEHMNPPLEALGAAVSAHDRAAFATAFEHFTQACNACHEHVHFGFNRVIRPTALPVVNQDFRPAAVR
jgi:hypothetical protein